MHNDTILKTTPAVFAVGKTYQISVLVSCEALMWIKVGDECYYDASNGIMRSRTSIHKVSVPMEKLDAEKKYIVCYRKIIERKPYFTETEDIIEIPFGFKPVPKDNIRAYHISDTHNRVNAPVVAARTYEENFGNIDFLIMNGDIPHHSGSIENFDVIYQIAEELTHGNIPIVFSRGNHDTRGIYAENIADYTPCRDGNSYYTFRLGDIWGIILDCGEDKDDSLEEYGHTICCHDFRKKETKYIEEVIASGEKEYNEEGIRHRVVIVHVPFTRRFVPPFNIEEEIYSEWAKLLKEKVKPDVMMCGHKHKFAINRQGDEEDKLGQPCTVVVGSHLNDDYFGGCGYEFNADGITATFTDNEGKVLIREKI